MSAKTHMRSVAPTTKKRAVSPKRLPNAKYRSREHLTPKEVDRLIEAAKCNRYRLRDETMVTVCYRHALRASEVCELEWSQVNFDEGTLYVRRAKNGKPSTHYAAMKSGCCARLRLINNQLHRLSLPASEVDHSHLRASIGWSSAPARRQTCRSKSMPICSGTAPATSSPMTIIIFEPFKIGWATNKSHRPRATPN